MEQATAHSVERASSGFTIDVDKAPERVQGSFLAIEPPTDSEEEEGEGEGEGEGEDDVHSVYEIESDRDEEIESGERGVVRYGLRSRRRGRSIVDSESEGDDETSPPPKRRRTAAPRKRALLNEPVKVFIPPEIWLRIFSFSHPKFLGRARRVSKAFKSLIDDEKIWKSARCYHFPEYPDPVLGLKEWEMWNLYLGVGCMICHAPKIRKRYWRFRIRCCVDCLKSNTVKEYLLKDRPKFKAKWTEYLIPGALDSWGHWKTPSMGRAYSQNIYWLDDVKILEMRMKPNQISGKILKAEVLQARRDIEIIERFEEKLSQKNVTGMDPQQVCRQRCSDIMGKCSGLNPPFTEEVLSHIPAFQSAIRASRPLTDRSWKILLKKLETGREAAEIRVAEIKRISEELKFSNFSYSASVPMKSWIDLFWTQNSRTVEHGCEASFALQALKFARTRWFLRGEERLLLRTILILWNEKLNDILHKPGRIFICAFCDELLGMDAVFGHITVSHSRDMGWAGITGDTPSNYWQNQEWPAELPILPFGKVFEVAIEGTLRPQQGHLKPQKGHSKPKEPPPRLHLPAPFTWVQAKLLPEQKDFREYHQGQMTEILSRVQAFKEVPDSHRFFLWFHLSITSYFRQYDQIPNLIIFALAADIVQNQKREPLLRSLLKCGVCGTYKSRGRKPFNWLNLSNHFHTHSSNRDQSWPERIVMLPSRADISQGCSKISDQVVRKRWIELAKEADKQLGMMMEDVVRWEEDKAHSRGTSGEKDRKGVKVHGKEAVRPGDVRIEPRSDGEKSVGLGGVGIEMGKPLQPGSQRDQWPNFARIKYALSGGTEPVREPKREFEPEKSGVVEHEKKRLRVGHVSPERGYEDVVTYKNMPVPQFSAIPPQKIVGVPQARETPTKPVEVPPKAQVMVKVQAPEKTTGGLTRTNWPKRPNILPEIYEIRDRSRSPSVDIDLEELFADG